MNEGRFEHWLRTKKDYQESTINSRISNCKRVEKYEGNLDNHFETDELEGLIEDLTYSREDKRQKHKVPINGDFYKGSATLKQAVKLYCDFKKQSLANHGQIINIGEERHKRSQKRRGVTKLKNSKKKWPEWSQPPEEEVLNLAKVLTPFVRFLKPEIIGKVTEDNRKHQAEWSKKLKECKIDPKIYLWDSSPCAFPGVRRYIGEEKNHRELSKPDWLKIDKNGNSFPKKLWTAVVYECKGIHQPKDYHLAHLFDHKDDKNRYKEETEGWEDLKEDLKFSSLFTCSTNTVYLPKNFIRPTDFSPKLRTLLQRKASDLYSEVCQILPHELEVADCNDPKWDIKNFEWNEPVGDITYVNNFLDFRFEKMNKLFEEYHSK